MPRDEPSLTDAIVRFDRRKKTLGVSGGEMQSEETARKLFVGLDLDYQELLDLRKELAIAPLYAIAHDQHVAHVLVGQWIDGLVTGMMLMELRAEKEARDGEG